MQKSLLLLLCLFLLLEGLNAETVEGVVRDASSGEPLAYVNIGVVGKNVGTVSDTQGLFQLGIEDQYNQDELRVSMVGYRPQSFTVVDFKEQMRTDPIIKLTEAVVQMKEVVVRDKKYKGRKLKERIIGNTKAVTTNQTYFKFNQLGNEMGILLKVRRNPTFVQNFNLYITENKYDTFTFRLNFYSVRNGLPDENLLNENIIVNFTRPEGQLTIDLREYNIVLEDDTIVTMEWIEDLGKHGLSFATDAGSGTPTITRQTSQGDWKVMKGMYQNGIGITLRVLQ